jgi:uncharacterized protein YueI
MLSTDLEKLIANPKNWENFLKKYQGSVVNLLKKIHRINICVFDEEFIPRNEEEVNLALLKISLLPNTQNFIDKVRKTMKEDFLMLEFTNFNEPFNLLFHRNISCQILDMLTNLSHYDNYDVCNYFKEKSYKEFRPRNTKLVDEFVNFYYMEGQFSSSIRKVIAFSEQKKLEELDHYDIIDEIVDCFEQEDIKLYCQTFGLPKEMLEHFLKRYQDL